MTLTRYWRDFLHAFFFYFLSSVLFFHTHNWAELLRRDKRWHILIATSYQSKQWSQRQQEGGHVNTATLKRWKLKWRRLMDALKRQRRVLSPSTERSDACRLSPIAVFAKALVWINKYWPQYSAVCGPVPPPSRCQRRLQRIPDATGCETSPLLNVAHLIFIRPPLEYMHTQIVRRRDLSLG